ncbi:PemK family transcriptional regulator [bacterium BRH_c32]|jgi:mRNA interferase MazF|nr:MAG: PemK family transcriptional regulator [bacterium BRH_c32]
MNGGTSEEISLITKVGDVKRGEIWRVNLDPTIGSEIKKSRPVIVISSNLIGKLPIKIIVPLTSWDSKYEDSSWHIKIEPDRKNNLTRTSSIDTLQIRSVDIQRFIAPKIGVISADLLDEISGRVAVLIEY